MQDCGQDQLVYNAPETSYAVEKFEEHLQCVNDLLTFNSMIRIRVNKI